MKKFYKKKEKGFTLVELLAVLLVMAILALIAVPMVVNVINKARKQSYQRSIEAFVRATELAMQQWQMDHPNGTSPTNLSDYTSAGYAIEVKGDQVHCNEEIGKSSNGGIKLTGCYTEKSIKKYPDLTYTYDGDKIFEEEIYEEYSVGDTFTFGQAGYHVIKPSNKKSNYVTALKSEPLTYDEIIALFPDNDINFGLRSNGKMAYKYTNQGLSYVGHYDYSAVSMVINLWSSQYESSLVTDSYGYKTRLIYLEEAIEYLNIDSDRYTSNLDTPDWVDNCSYWTMEVSGESVFVGFSKFLSIFSLQDGENFVRPVINVKKSAISKN